MTTLQLSVLSIQSLSILAQMMRMQQITIDTLIVKTVGVNIRLLFLTIVQFHIILITSLRQLLISSFLLLIHNEDIHSILFQMVRKTEAVGMDTMKLGAALAVIRYNDGFAGVKKVFEIINSEAYVAVQQRGFAKRQRRGHKVRNQVKEMVKVILLENSLLLNLIL